MLTGSDRGHRPPRAAPLKGGNRVGHCPAESHASHCGSVNQQVIKFVAGPLMVWGQ